MRAEEVLMHTAVLSPLADVPVPAHIAALPKADLHIHAETAARLEQILAAQSGQPLIDHRLWIADLLATTPPGMPRLLRLDNNRKFDRATVDTLDTDPTYIIARIMHLLMEGAADRAVLIEITFGPATILKPDFMALFREAERRVQAQYPKLRAEALIAATQPTGAQTLSPPLLLHPFAIRVACSPYIWQRQRGIHRSLITCCGSCGSGLEQVGLLSQRFSSDLPNIDHLLQYLLDGSAQVLHQMKALGDLDGIRCASSRAFCKCSGTVTRDDFYTGMGL
jgi:hypothetical protein